MASDARAAIIPQRIVQMWGPALLALGIGLVVLGVAFYPTFASIVAIWNRSETFAHGFLIVPISLCLIWMRRRELMRLQPEPALIAVAPLLGLAGLWVMGDLVDVISVRQFAAVLMIPALVWLVLGSRITWRLQFPLAYLLFAVPFGEFLVPPLMDFTADFTVAAVQLSGIPVYREGLFFELPTGRWSVVEACSGVRYLIASVALGTLYAYLMYRSVWRRLLFVGVAILVPIVANGLRAYMIVMIGHLSNMEYATGVDHLIYGWIFFGIVIALMFWIGTFWREDREPAAPSPAQPGSAVGARRPGAGRFSLAALLAVSLAALGPAWAGWMNDRDLGAVTGLGSGPVVPAGWHELESDHHAQWDPGYRFARASRGGLVRADDGGQAVGMHLGFYREQHNHGNMVGWSNTLAGRHRDDWSQSRAGSVEFPDHGRAQRFLLRGPDQRVVAWRWYWVDGHLTPLPHEVKAREAFSRLLGGRDDAALIVIHAHYEDDPAEAEEAMRAYAEAVLPVIRERLDRVSAP